MGLEKCKGRPSPPPLVSLKLVQRNITNLCGSISKQYCTSPISPILIDSIYCSYKYYPLQRQQVVGAFNCHLLCTALPSVLPSHFPQKVHPRSICRHLQECSPLVLPHLTGVLASHRNEASTEHPSCDPSRVNEVVISLTDFILKYRYLSAATA